MKKSVGEMPVDEQIKWLKYLWKKTSFALSMALDELQKKGMTDKEMYEFVDDVNSAYMSVYEKEKLS